MRILQFLLTPLSSIFIIVISLAVSLIRLVVLKNTWFAFQKESGQINGGSQSC